ncbi:hypothetical protein Tco_0628449 [Tanacetum coccineum]|uniref:Uncharacterized protein n=1 Tax=Tanacetum coccineum TaxID=301880 RepID=A0ABQ4WQC9_9ASTR
MTTLPFADTHNLVAFLDKPAESEGFEQIVDFLNASSIRYALTVNPIIYTSCIQQFWATTKVKTVNGEVQLQALVDGKKVILTETSNMDSSVKFLMYPRFLQVFLNQQAGDMSNHKRIYVTPSHTKKVFGNMKREGKGFSGRVTPLFPTMMVQAQEEIANEAANEENVLTHSNDPLLSGEDSLKLNDLMEIYTKLQQRVLDLELLRRLKKEISSLKLRVKRLEKKGGSRTHKLKRLFKVGRSAQVGSSEDEGLGNQEDASKQGRKIDDIDKDAEVTLVDEGSQGRVLPYGDFDDLVFDTTILDGEEVFAGQDVVEKEVSTADPVTTASEVVTTASVEVSAATTTTTTAITKSTTILAPLTIPKAKRITFRDPGESTRRTKLTSIPSNIKDKGKAKMVEPEKPLKMKEQIRLDEELPFKLQAEEEKQARLAREKDKEQDKLTDEEKARLFVELLEKRKKHFAALRAQENRNKPPTKAQKKSTMSTYLKHMAGYKQSQLKNNSFIEIQKLFDIAMTRVNMFVDMDTELVKESSKKAEAEMAQESSSKRVGDELEQEHSKKQKMEDDKETAELQSMMEVIPDEEEVVVDAIPLATKPPSIVDWKIIKEGKIGYYQIIRADGNSKRYSSMIQMLKNFNRKDFETLWKLVKAKHGNTRPEEGYERVLWGDLKTILSIMFQDMHLFMLVEKRYPLTPATNTEMFFVRFSQYNLGLYKLSKIYSIGINTQSSNTEVVCTKEDDGEVMFIELIKNNDDSSDGEPEEEGSTTTEGVGAEYFDIFPTRSELAYHKYLMCSPILSIFLRNPIITEGRPSNLKIPCNIRHVHVEKAYIDLNSPLNIMTRMMYNWIMRRKLNPRENSNRGVSKFTGRIKGMHVFI